ncbi:MAG TPA: RdgB/HAM1 family non-canonical purine NTP pyrophosphatase [Acidimicrobiales bacterium]|nr:RdgB/HAM1 family non-canonical purine NTP pyrophosphatase [Acidimicrobiales bacterium]HUX03661.1 RdgB/HAM1 family non-canonical purine NTP pyrophosphatase [Acidimicrobiales bacterium]
MLTFVLATANPHKAEEMRSLLASFDVTVLERPAGIADVDETEDTLEGNALLKARALAAATGLPAVADDTGLFVNALGGRPGVWSARYAGEGATYTQNVAKLLDEMHGVVDEDRGASFRTVIAVAYPDGQELCVEGELRGSIAREARGAGGFGYDPVFVVEDDGRTLAEMSANEKNELSHRARALRALAIALDPR